MSTGEGEEGDGGCGGRRWKWVGGDAGKGVNLAPAVLARPLAAAAAVVAGRQPPRAAGASAPPCLPDGGGRWCHCGSASSWSLHRRRSLSTSILVLIPFPFPFLLLVVMLVLVLILLDQTPLPGHDQPFATAPGLPERGEGRSSPVSIWLMERCLRTGFFIALEFV